jgi:large subunit ribosomal protein L9
MGRFQKTQKKEDIDFLEEIMKATQIILTENVEGLGKIGDLVRVKPGYARNFLVPRALAVEANPRNINELNHQKRQMERKMQKLTQAAEVLKARLEGIACVFAHRASEEGKLFGSVTTMEIESKLGEAGIEIDRKKIQLDEPIKALGDYEVPIKLQAGVTATLKVSVVAVEEG